MPKISVIVPNYNHEKYIKLRIESILNQKFSDFEVIILDDASADNSVDYINEYDYDPRIKHILVNDVNSGSTFKQWQKGFEKATGEYIWIAESDDEADQRFLMEVMKTFEDNENIGVVFSPSVWIDAQSKEIHKPKHEEDEEYWKGDRLVQNEFLIGNVIYNASSAVFKRNLLKFVDFNNLSTFKYAGDWMFWVQIIPHTFVYRLSRRYNYFRRHNDNISFKSDSEGLQFIEGIRISEHILDKFPISFVKKRKTMIYWAKKLIFTNINNKPAILKKMPLEMRFWYKTLNSIIN